MGKGQGKNTLRTAPAPALLPPCRWPALHGGTGRKGRGWLKAMMSVKCRYAGSAEQVCKSELREEEHSNTSVLGIKDRFPQKHKPNLAVPLRAALNTTYGRCLKQGSDTKHVPSKHKTWKKLSSYQLFVTQTKYERGFFDWPALLSPGEDMEGTLAPGTGDVLHGAPVLSTFALTATLVSVDFGKKVTTAEICHLNLISCCL